MATYSQVTNESDSWQSYQLLRKEELWDSEEDLWGHSGNWNSKPTEKTLFNFGHTFYFIGDDLVVFYFL